MNLFIQPSQSVQIIEVRLIEVGLYLVKNTFCLGEKQLKLHLVREKKGKLVNDECS